MSFEAYQKGMEGNIQAIHELKEQMSNIQQELESHQEILEKVRTYVDRQKKEEKERRTMYDILDRLSPGWREPYFNSLPTPPHELRKKAEEFLEKMRDLPDSDSADNDEDNAN
jgi:hypothetical protein